MGIKGVAMTALAILAKESGVIVSGSDVQEEFPTDMTLHRFGISYDSGFADSHLPQNLDLVIYTGAHQGVNNIEVQTAKTRGIPVLPHGKALGLFMEGKRGISVAGSHGKTTTSALIAHTLMHLGKDPSFAVGCGEILSLKTSGHLGKGDFFVVEGDEYVTDPTSDQVPRFMWQKPEVLVITNIDFDHPDVYKDLKEVKKAFVDFANSLSEKAIVVVNIDNEPLFSILQQIKRKIITYGQKEGADFKLGTVTFNSGETVFEIYYKNKKSVSFSLKIPGVHNAQNATGAIAALVNLGIQPEELREPILTFSGTKRRFEFVAEKNNKLLYDDYAHHPTEIEATLNAARGWFPEKRLVVIFQPHTYSRTQALLSEFGKCFTQADRVLLTEIYASAREEPISGISGIALYEEIKKRHLGVHFAPKRNDVLQWLEANSRQNDLILTMGAGDIFTWIPSIMEII